MRYPECVEKLVIINSPHPAVFARELLNNPDQQVASQYMLLFRSAKAGLFVYDLHGRLVAKLDENRLDAEKYSAVWQPDRNLPNGYYFIVLTINDLQVHYQKVVLTK